MNPIHKKRLTFKKRDKTAPNSLSEKQKTHIGTNLYNQSRENISKLNEFDVSKSSYTMYELTDIKILEKLIDSDLIDSEERKSLNKYLRLARRGNGKVKVEYSAGKIGFGRYFAKMLGRNKF